MLCSRVFVILSITFNVLISAAASAEACQPLPAVNEANCQMCNAAIADMDGTDPNDPAVQLQLQHIQAQENFNSACSQLPPPVEVGGGDDGGGGGGGSCVSEVSPMPSDHCFANDGGHQSHDDSTHMCCP